MKIYTKVSVVVEQDGEILLLKEWSNKKNGHYWNLVKGTFGDKENETLAECAVREVKEEAGLDIQIDSLLSCYIYAEKIVGIQFNFRAHPKDGNKVVIPSKDEQKSRGEDIVETKWVTKEEALEISPDEFISKRIYKVIGDWAQNKLYAFETLTSME